MKLDTLSKKKNMLKTGLVAVAMTAALSFSSLSSAANLLTNASFETPDASAGDVAGAGSPWNSFNSNFTTSNLFGPPVFFVNPDAKSGTQVLKQFGTDAGSFQDVAASEGDLFEASAWAQSWGGDPNNNTGLLQLFFRDATTNLCDPGGFNACAQAVFDTSQPVDTWVQLLASAIAPEGTTIARIQLILVPDDETPAGGALFWDDASLGLAPVPVPAAAWLFGSALLGLAGIGRKRA
jgi:hypothetical protein